MSSSVTSVSSGALFQAGGLSSGMDTGSIIDQLVKLESTPIAALEKRQTAMKTQISSLASIVSKLSALTTAAQDLADGGVAASKVTSTNTAFSATPGTSADSGSYSVEVQALARAAKWRSAAFTSGEGLSGGTLDLTVQGKAYAGITIADGASLADVAYAVKLSGAPVSAVVLDDGTDQYLSFTNRDTGYPLAGTAADTLAISFSAAAGATGRPLTYSDATSQPQAQAATNAQVAIDGLLFTRTSNLVTDALPGTTLSLTKAAPGAAEELTLSSDTDATATRLQSFVDAYNGVMALVQAQLNVNKDTDRATSLVGNPAVRALQGRLHALTSAQIPGLGSVRSLADVGIKSAKDGSLSVDATALARALATDSGAINSLFSTAGTGLASVVDKMVQANVRAGDGALVISQDGLNRNIDDMSLQADRLQLRVDSFRQNLVNQFTAMESTVGSLKNVSSFLTSQDKKSSS